MWKRLLTFSLPALVVTSAMAQSAAPADGIRVLLSPAIETVLASQFSGQVQALDATLGQRVKKGAVLVRFDCSEPDARLRMARAELDSARETHDAKTRLKSLQQASDVEVSLAASAADRAKAQVSLYNAQSANCKVIAPFSGRVVSVSVKPHQGVSPGQPLVELISDGPLKLRLNAPAAWVRWLKVGTAFNVDIDETGQRYGAKVTAMNARIDAVSQSIELEATLNDAAPELLAGMSGTAHFDPPN